MLNEIKNYLHKERTRHVNELVEFIRIPSVSSSSQHKEYMNKAAEWLANQMKNAGLEHVEIMETEKHPVIYGDWMHAKDQPTALIYGHYDVQSAEPTELWTYPPYEGVIHDNILYGRGATDDKGQLYIHIKTVEAYLKTKGTLPVNVKFCIEGEEEIASPSLKPFLKEHQSKLKADLIVISDGPMHEKGQPSICCGLRGLCALELEVKGANRDVHSGLYGGGIANPITVMSQIVASMFDSNGQIAIEGFYEGVRTLTASERASIAAIPMDEKKLSKELDVSYLFGEKGFSFIERTSVRPTLEMNGMYGGYQGQDIKTIIPSNATAKISCRLVDQQDPDHIYQLIHKHIVEHAPNCVSLEIRPLHGGKPYVISSEHPFMRVAEKAIEYGFKKSPIFIRSGGSIPIVEAFSGLLHAPVIMLDFGLPGENLHAPNEHFHLENFDKGLLTMVAFWKELSRTI